MNDEMRITLKKIDKLISKKGFVYALIMAQIEDISIDTIYLNQERLSGNEILFIWGLLVNKGENEIKSLR